MKTLLSSLLLLSLVPSAAHALSCADGPYASVPKDGSSEVPLNARVAVWYSFSTPDELPLHLINNATGEEVPTSTSDIEDSGGVFLLVPDSPLDTDTSYSVTVTRGDTLASEGTQVTQFTTGSQIDEDSPSQPIISAVSKSEDNTDWGPTDSVNATVKGANEVVYYRMEVADNEDFIQSESSTMYAWDGIISVGHGLCTTTLTREAMSVKQVRLIAIDLAGNESIVSESAKSMGCSAVGLSGVSWLGLGLLPIFMRRRRF